MIDVFESSNRINPDGVFFTFVDEIGQETQFTYRYSRAISAALARKLKAMGVRPGQIIAVDLQNCPEFVFIALACAYGGYTLAALNPKLNSAEKFSRLQDLGRTSKVACHIDEDAAHSLLGDVRQTHKPLPSVIARIVGEPRRERSIMGEGADYVHDTVHFAERAAHLFSNGKPLEVIFASGGSGRAKQVALTWEQLAQASRILNAALEHEGMADWQERLPLSMSNPLPPTDRTVWQLCIPLYTVDGFQTMVRAAYSMFPFRMYARFDAEQILRDARLFGITHIGVRDRMLQDLLTVEEWRTEFEPGVASRLANYRCILMCNRTINPLTVQRGLDLNVRLFATYGMAETSGPIACSRVTSAFRGGLHLLPEYEVRIADADIMGFGSLAVRGPGVFRKYLNANAAFTLDRYFVVGDKAIFRDGEIYIDGRTVNIPVPDFALSG